MDFDFSPDELAFEREVETFLAAVASPDVMDPNPEQRRRQPERALEQPRKPQR